MKYEDYSSLKINVDRKVAFVTVDHPTSRVKDF